MVLVSVSGTHRCESIEMKPIDKIKCGSLKCCSSVSYLRSKLFERELRSMSKAFKDGLSSINIISVSNLLKQSLKTFQQIPEKPNESHEYLTPFLFTSTIWKEIKLEIILQILCKSESFSRSKSQNYTNWKKSIVMMQYVVFFATLSI